MNRVIVVLLAALASLGLGLWLGGQTAPEQPSLGTVQSYEPHPYETIPVIDAYYQGEKVWFIHTDVSSEPMAERLTKMVGYRTLHAPQIAQAARLDQLGKIYVFTNGVRRRDAKPWGGGPFGYQIDVVDSVPGDADYTSWRHPQLVTWTEEATPRVLTSADAIRQAEAAGHLTIKPTDVVVNVPIVDWPRRAGD